jgi:hypothetical protein
MAFLKDGHPTLVTFESFTSVLFKHQSVTPFGVDGGNPNDVSAFENEEMRTMVPPVLKTATPMSLTVFYDPAIIDDIWDMVNQNQRMTVTHSDTSGWRFWGWLRSFVPNRNVDNSPPTADIVLQPSNLDNSFNEVKPEYIPAP